MSNVKTWHYRCLKCRGRNKKKKPIDHYVRVQKCRHCGHAGFYLDKERQNRKDICRDEACCHYPHRYRSSLCLHHPQAEIIIRTGRYGEPLADVLADIARRKAEEENQVAQAENTVAA